MDYQQNFKNNQLLRNNNPYNNISANQLSAMNIGYAQTLPLYNNAVVPQISLYNQNNTQLKPISYANNSYLYTLQNTNYNQIVTANPTNYLITPQQQELPFNTTDNGLRTSYPYSIPLYNMQPSTVLVNPGYAYNNISNINTQYANTLTTPLTIPVQLVPNYRTSLLLQNGYVKNYNNAQIQNILTSPNNLYLPNQKLNMVPRYETKSYEPEEENTDTNNLIPNYNIVNTNETIKPITTQTYENNLNTINYYGNINYNNSLGGDFYSNANIQPVYKVQTTPISRQSYQKLALPPMVIVPKSNENYIPIKKKRYVQSVKALNKKREKVIIPAYEKNEKYIPIKERVSIRENGNSYIPNHDNISNIENIVTITSEQENNYIPIIENKYISEQDNNYIPNNENNVISEQNTNYIRDIENPIISSQNNNYIPNTENLVISEQNNNYITSNPNIALSSQESNNIPNNENVVTSEQENNYIPNNENVVIIKQENNNIPNNENIVISDEQNNNYLSNDENKYIDNNTISGQKNIIYIPKVEKIIVSEKENNYLPNAANNIISEKNNNYIQTNENDVISGEENNYLPTNDDAIISGEDNIYNQDPNKIKMENKVLPPRKSFIKKPLSFKFPNKKLSKRLDYNSAGVRATSPLYFSGDKATNLAPLSSVKTPFEPSKEN